MMRTTFSEKNGRIRIEREMQCGPERWQLVTRLSAASLREALERYPQGWRGTRVMVGPLGYMPEWDRLTDDLLWEPRVMHRGPCPVGVLDCTALYYSDGAVEHSLHEVPKGWV